MVDRWDKILFATLEIKQLLPGDLFCFLTKIDPKFRKIKTSGSFILKLSLSFVLGKWHTLLFLINSKQQFTMLLQYIVTAHQNIKDSANVTLQFDYDKTVYLVVYIKR